MSPSLSLYDDLFLYVNVCESFRQLVSVNLGDISNSEKGDLHSSHNDVR